MTCPICNDDGWVDIPDEETGGVLGPMECPRLHHLGHAMFNATGLLPGAAPPSSDGPSDDPARETAPLHGIRRECDSCGKRGTTIFSPAHNAHFCAECFKAETARLNHSEAPGEHGREPS